MEFDFEVKRRQFIRKTSVSMESRVVDREDSLLPLRVINLRFRNPSLDEVRAENS